MLIILLLKANYSFFVFFLFPNKVEKAMNESLMNNETFNQADFERSKILSNTQLVRKSLYTIKLLSKDYLVKSFETYLDAVHKVADFNYFTLILDLAENYL